MKLVLTHEVTGLGTPGDVVEVKDGYGRNYLVPRGLAVLATRGVEKQAADIKRARAARSVRDLAHAQEIAAQLGSLTVTLPVRAGQGGRLFGSVTVTDIVAAVKTSGGPDLDRRRVEIGNPIKSVGSTTVSVRLHPDVTVTLALQVVAAS
jgi:large subunit ribosomal protein L9